MTQSIMVGVRLPVDLHASLNIEAIKSKITISEIIRKHLEPQPDITGLFMEQFKHINDRLTAIDNSQIAILDNANSNSSGYSKLDIKYALLWNRLCDLIDNNKLDTDDANKVIEASNFATEMHKHETYSDDTITYAERYRSFRTFGRYALFGNLTTTLKQLNAWYQAEVANE